MTHINVTINGRQYRMACEAGQENRLLRLAESLEARIASLRGKFGEIGDQRRHHGEAQIGRAHV